MKLLFTNTYSETNKDKQKKMSIEIKGKCEITNYNPNEREYDKSKGDLRVEITENGVNVMGKKQSNDCVKLNDNKYSIFTALATMDKNGSDKELTFSDLDVARHSGLQKLKDILKNLQLELIGNPAIDPDKGIFRLNFKNQNGKGETIRIDFETEQEKSSIEEFETRTPKASANNSNAAKDLTKPATNSKVEASGMNKFYSSIPASYDKYIKKAAKDAGVSEDFIRHLITCEGKASKAVLTAYKCRNGIWTIGFGHTNATGVNPFEKSEKTTITLEQAFQYLVDDIKVHRADCKAWLKGNFNNAPQYIQEGIIDRSFQAGQRGFRDATLEANLGDKDCYPAFIARCLWVNNDPRRSALRFLLAANGLNDDMQGSAKRRFTSLGHEGEVLGKLIGAEKKYFVQEFNNLEKG